MARTLINLPAEDKTWLDKEARSRHVPMTELVRQAVHDYRLREQNRAHPNLQVALKETSGIWRRGDAMEYQARLRDEWDDGG
ncbi:MAG: ribbon-helix-helix protein, CopG family [Nitrosospira sp.]|nr:ribbon-helix-helix protein, CopG family [Nitrosospira sp.]